MLTAVNVARSCRMVEPKEQVIFVSACPPSHDKPAALKFIPAELSQGEEQPEVSLEARSWGALPSPEHRASFQCRCLQRRTGV